MKEFITLTTTKGEKFLCNIKKIVYIGEVKDGSVVYIDEFTRLLLHRYKRFFQRYKEIFHLLTWLK